MLREQNDTIRQNSKAILYEFLTWGLFLALKVYLLRKMLIFGDKTFSHDIFHWFLSIFSFFVDSLKQGNFPLWDLYSQGGVPFYPLIVGLKMLDPVLLLISFIALSFTDNLILVFNWVFFGQLVFMSLVTYIFLRNFADGTFIKITLFLCFCFPSFFFHPFAQMDLSILLCGHRLLCCFYIE